MSAKSTQRSIPTSQAEGGLAKSIENLGLNDKLKSAVILAEKLPLTQPRLYFTGLPKSTTLAQAQQVFQPYQGTNVKLSAMAKPGMTKGQVDFPTVVDAEFVFATLHGTAVTFLGADAILYLSPSETIDPYRRALELSQPRLIVRQLPKCADAKSLYLLFRTLGHIFSCRLAYNNRGEPRDYAVLQYLKPDLNDQAIMEFNLIEYKGNNITVENFLNKDRKFTPRLGQRLPSLNNPALGEEQSVSRVQPDSSVTSPKLPTTPVTPRTTQFPGTKASPSQGRHGAQDLSPVRNDHYKVFVKGVHYSVSHSDLFQMFKPYGYIYSARINIDEQTKTSKGSGVVLYANSEAVAKAIEALNGHEVMGRKLVVMPYDSSLAPISATASPAASAGTGVTQDFTEGTPSKKGGPTRVVSGSGAPHQAMSSGLDKALLSQLSSTAREEVVKVHLMSHFSTHPGIPLKDAPAVAGILSRLPLDTVIAMLNDNALLVNKVKEAQTQLNQERRQPTGRGINTGMSESSHLAQDQPRLKPATGKISRPPKESTSDVNPGIASTGNSDSQSYRASKSTPPATKSVSTSDELVNGPQPSTTKPTCDSAVSLTDEDPVIEAFIKTLLEKSGNERKQKLGSKLFPMIKGLGVRDSTKVTVWLLDNKEDVRYLAYCIKDTVRLRQCVEEAQAVLGL
ncbi:hypothetical protein IWQ61_006725 [Dispira simplex]|nr:hypothetical protein IWQ61_006725 [Dispira simplex]